jgi:hypothetical protein
MKHGHAVSATTRAPENVQAHVRQFEDGSGRGRSQERDGASGFEGRKRVRISRIGARAAMPGAPVFGGGRPFKNVHFRKRRSRRNSRFCPGVAESAGSAWFFSKALPLARGLL